jgi:glutamyl-tRNA synthetase
MIRFFDVNHINKSPAAFNTEKLLWLNQHYLKTLPPDYVAGHLAWHLQQLGLDPSKGPALIELVKAQAERVKTLKEMAERSHYFYSDEWHYDEAAVVKHFTPEIAPVLNSFARKLEAITSWEKEEIHKMIEEVSLEFGMKLGKIGPAIRIAVTGNTVSPSLDVTLFLIGQARCVQRLKKAAHFSILHAK